MYRLAVAAAAVAVMFISLPAKSPSNVDLKDSRVDVPWKEFKQIIDRLSQPDTIARDTLYAPTDYVLTSAQIKGSMIDNKSASFTVLLDCTVLPGPALKQEGWIAVRLGPIHAAAVLKEASVGGNTLPLHTENNEYQVLISKAGVYTIKLAYHCCVSSAEGTNSINLTIPKTLAASLDFIIPDVNADVVVNGSKSIIEKTGGGIHVRTPVSTAHALRIDYTPLGVIQEGGEDSARITPRVYAATGLLVDIRENQIRYQYRIDYQIWHKKLTSFAIALPDTYSMEEVEGAGIAQWKMERREGKPVIAVQTNFTPEKQYSLTLRFSRKLETMAGRIAVPSLTALNVHRENGCLAIAAQQTMEVSAADSLDGLSAMDQSELHSWMQSRQDLLMRFKYIHPPFKLFLDVKRHADMPVLVAIADDVQFTTLLTSDGCVLSRFVYQIRNNHKQFLRVTMPGGWRLWSALIDGGPVMPATSGDAELLIPLKKMASDGNGEGFRLELVYWKEWKKMGFWGRFAFSMPDIDINTQSIAGNLWVPNNFRYGGFKGSLEKTAAFTWSEYNREQTTWSSSNERQRQGRRPGMTANQQIAKIRQGMALALPVEISVPTEGLHYQFAKKLTISGEKADLSVSFRKRLPDVGNIAGFLFPLGFFLVGFIAMRLPLRHRTRTSIIVSLAAGLAMMVILLFVQAIVNDSSAGIVMLLIGMVAAVIAHAAFASKNRKASGVAGLLLLLCFAYPLPCFSRDIDTGLANSTVAIPWSDFKQILDKIKKPKVHDTVTIVPPVAYVIGSGEYRGERLNEKQFVFAAHLVVSVLEKTSWVEIPFAQGAAVYPDVKVTAPSGAAASIGTTASGANAVVAKGPGSYDVSYRFVAPVGGNAGVSTMQFPMTSQTATSIRIELDKPDYRVTANDIPLAVHVAGAGRSVYEGAIGMNSIATVTWRQEVTQISAQDAMLLGQVNTFYSIGLGLIQMTSEIDLSVIHQDIREFTFSLPRRVDVVDLTGPAVLTWGRVDTVGGGERQSFKALFKYRVRNRASFQLTAEQSYGDSIAALKLPDLLLNNASRQEGFIAVGVTSNIELTQEDQSANVLRKDRRELPPWFESAEDILFGYQYLSGSYQVSFSVKRHGNVSGLAALVEQADMRSVIREDGKTITEITMNVKNRGEQFIRLGWQPHLQLWSLYCNDKPARPSYDSTTSELLVPLEKAAEQSAMTAIKLVYLAQNRGFGFAGKCRLAIPAVNMPSQNVTYTVYVPAQIDVFYSSGNLHPTETEKRRGRPWFSMPEIVWPAPGYIASDFYEKIPEQVTERQKKEEEMKTDKTTLKPSKAKGSGGTHGGGGDPRSRVTQKGTLGIISGPVKGKSVASADIFGKGGSAGDIDSLLQGVGGLNKDESGGVGREGVAGIGFGAGYGSGFGGQGGDVDDIIAGLSGDAAAPIVQQQVSPLPYASVEAGQLSLPIDVTFDGTPHFYKSLLLKNQESPDLSLFYRKIPTQTPFIVHLILFLLTITAGVILTLCFWSGWTMRKALYGVVLPLAAALVLCGFMGIPLGLGWVFIIPPLFFLWRAGISVVRHVKKKNKEREAQFEELASAIKTDAKKSSAGKTPSQKAGDESKENPPSAGDGK